MSHRSVWPLHPPTRGRRRQTAPTQLGLNIRRDWLPAVSCHLHGWMDPVGLIDACAPVATAPRGRGCAVIPQGHPSSQLRDGRVRCCCPWRRAWATHERTEYISPFPHHMWRAQRTPGKRDPSTHVPGDELATFPRCRSRPPPTMSIHAHECTQPTHACVRARTPRHSPPQRGEISKRDMWCETED